MRERRREAHGPSARAPASEPAAPRASEGEGSGPSWRIVGIALAFLAITIVHGVVAHETHGAHVVHALFGALYLIPTVAAAVWLRPSAGVFTSIVAAAAYVLHARMATPGDAMQYLAHYSMAAVYVFVGSASAVLVRAAARERERREAVEWRAEREAAVQAIASLSNALRSRDDATAGHSDRVARTAERIARRLRLPATEIETIRLAGLVHDVGKIGIRDDVLLKPGALTPGERALVERHPVIAAEILAPLRGGAEIARIVVAHHEAPDGSGYPARLTAGQIPLGAAIVRAADVYEALAEARPYKPELSPAQVIETMRAWQGKLDERVFRTLEAMVADAPPAAHP